MAKPGSSSSQKTSRPPPKPSEKATEKTAAAASLKGPKSAAKPDGKDPKAGKPTALPDAALIDDDAEGADSAASPRRGLAAWLPTGRKRWIVLGSAAGGLLGMITAAAVAASHFHTPPKAPEPTVIAGPAHAVDGATVTVAGQTVRLEAIDAPAASFICRDGAWKYRCGDAARRALDEAIGPAPVECVHLRPEGRQITALCRNDSGLDLAAIQVESGWAVNDIQTSSRYVAEQFRAEHDASGLWRNDFAHPELWHESPHESPSTAR